MAYSFGTQAVECRNDGERPVAFAGVWYRSESNGSRLVECPAEASSVDAFFDARETESNETVGGTVHSAVNHNLRSVLAHLGRDIEHPGKLDADRFCGESPSIKAGRG
jgi:hypothetical protein